MGMLGGRPTNKRRAIAVGKDIAHEGLCINASILVTRARWCEHGFVDLKVNQRSGCWSLSRLKRIVRTLERIIETSGRDGIGCAQQYKDIQAKETIGPDQGKKHSEGRRLSTVSAIWQSNLPCDENIPT